MEQLAARWVVAFSMVLIGAFSLIRFLPSPAALPEYARFLPVDLSPAQVMGREGQAIGSNETNSNETGSETTSSAMATITVESANCRAKPRGNAERITFLYRDQELEIVGWNGDPNNPWWFVKIPEGNCWLWGLTATTTGPTENLPINP